MENKKLGMSIFIVGAIIMFAAVMYGNGLQDDLRSYSLEGFATKYGVAGQLRFFSFAFGFPMGLGLALIGVALLGNTNQQRIIYFLIVTILATLAPGIIPAIFGRSLSAVYFGGGGYIMMVLTLIAIWYWGQYRMRVAASKHLALDLQGMGYLCFAVAIWDLCGAATMPSFSLEPEMMIQKNAQAFAIGQMKSIMALFIIGWIFTLLGFRESMKQSVNE